VEYDLSAAGCRSSSKARIEPDRADLVHPSPLDREHINLTGDDHWDI
jgi:hypothetical protein